MTPRHRPTAHRAAGVLSARRRTPAWAQIAWTLLGLLFVAALLLSSQSVSADGDAQVPANSPGHGGSDR